MSKPVSDPVTFERIAVETKNDNECGVCSWKPHWLQRLANPKAFLIVFCMLGLLQGAYFAYLIGILSTIEKRYSFESKVTGLILIADNISPVFTSTFIGYYGGKADRPKWIASGMFFVAGSYFLSALPYFIYGPAKTLASATDFITNKTEICEFESWKNGGCELDQPSLTVPAVTCFVVASFIKGFGSTAYYTIGLAYLDDNVPKKQSPLYLGITYTLKMVGPMIGFLISSVCLRYYEDPTYDPGFSKEDPRWIGAWWIGFVGLGFVLMLFSIPMLFFPRVLPTTNATDAVEAEETDNASTVKDMVTAIKRTMKTPVIFWFFMNSLVVSIGLCGHYTFLPKYLETQFHKAASDANLFSGPTALICMQVGTMLGAVLICKYKPSPQYIAASLAFVDALTTVFFIAFTMMGCPQVLMKGTEWKDGRFLLNNDCNRHCSCTTTVFEPVCASESQSTYFSSCFAGCTEHNETAFGNCSCVHNKDGDFVSSDVIPNYCPTTCDKLIPYIVLLGILRVISSLTSVGNSLLFFRATGPKDKCLAIGFGEALYCLFVFIPYPLIFGAITDAACLVWEERCGTTGNCWIYDAEKFRYYLHGVVCGLSLIGVFCDFALIYYSKDIKDFYEDEIPENVSKERRRSIVRERFSSVSINRTCSIK